MINIAHKFIILHLIPFFICLSILQAKPVQYSLEKGADSIAVVLYIPAVAKKDTVEKTGYLFTESDMNYCLSWGKNSKNYEKTLIEINKNQKDDNNIIYLTIGVVLGIFAGFGIGKITN